MDTLKVSCENADLDIYVIEGENAYDIVKQFRHVIGRSYIPPKFAFGFGQSRWGFIQQKKISVRWQKDIVRIISQST